MIDMLVVGNRDPAMGYKIIGQLSSSLLLRDASLSLRAVFSQAASGAPVGWGLMVLSGSLFVDLFFFPFLSGDLF
jgi:hypothetical protein